MGSHNDIAPQVVLIDRKQFQQILCIKKSTFFEWKRRDTNFPAPLLFSGGRTVRWRLADAMGYIETFQKNKKITLVNGSAQ